MSARSAVAASVAFTAMLGGCGGGPAAVRLSARDDGRVVGVERGATIEVWLDSNPSTGFGWSLVERPDAAVLSLVSSRFVPADEDEEPPAGRGGTEVWTFEADAPGATSLRLAYVRSWEPERAEGRFTLRVRVGEP
ncbi:MAG TPA: protease inhibitor I42 family protein [Gaiellaceae bacterium]|nr:protease inhibitor I42 family protein [Gaiellaceae bacterium]